MTNDASAAISLKVNLYVYNKLPSASQVDLWKHKIKWCRSRNSALLARSSHAQKLAKVADDVCISVILFSIFSNICRHLSYYFCRIYEAVIVSDNIDRHHALDTAHAEYRNKSMRFSSALCFIGLRIHRLEFHFSEWIIRDGLLDGWGADFTEFVRANALRR